MVKGYGGSLRPTQWGSLGLLLGITLVALVGMARLRLDPANTSLFLRADHDALIYQQFLQMFGSDETILVALHDPQQALLTPTGLAAIRQLTQELTALPHVASVYSLTNAPDMTRLRITPFGLAVPRLIPDTAFTADGSPETLPHKQAVHGALLSADLHTAGIFVTPATGAKEAAPRHPWITAVRTVAAQHATAGRHTYVAGIPIERHDVTQYLDRDQRLITPLVLLLLLALTTWMYRVKRLVGVVLVCMVLPLVWTMGLAGWYGLQLNAMTSLLPAVLLIVSVSLSIHLISQILQEAETGADHLTTITRAITHVQLPSFFAALTTALGFFSLLASPIPAIREFALFAALGVILALYATLMVAPLILRCMGPMPALPLSPFRGGRLERWLLGLARWVPRHSRHIFVGVAGVALLALPGIARLTEGTDIIRTLRENAPLRRSSEFIDQHLTGVNSLELMIRFPDNTRDALPASIRHILAFSEWLRRQPDITTVFSPWELLRDAPPELLSQDEQLIVLGTLLPLAYPLDAWLDAKSHTMRLSVRVQAVASERLLALEKHLRDYAATLSLPLQITGRTYLLARMSRVLVRSQLVSLGVAILTIGVSIMLMLRSWKLGCIAMLPNILPSMLVFGLMGWCQIELSTATVMIASIALGLLVDDTIHLLYHYRQARRTGCPPRDAMERTIGSVGRAIVSTSLFLIGGFWGGLLGSFKPTVYFAFLTGLTMLFALLVVLLVVPAIVLVWDRPTPANRSVL